MIKKNNPMININIFLHHRDNFLELHLKHLAAVRPEYLEKIRINVLASRPLAISDFPEVLKDKISVKVCGDYFNYMNKVETAVLADAEYSVKVDEDCFVAPRAWEYLVRNIEVLTKYPEILCLLFSLSSGIPTTDEFVRDYFCQKDQQQIYWAYKNHEFDLHANGINVYHNDPELYIPLNKHTIHAPIWNPLGFYDSVRKINHFYKGVHPCRCSPKNQILLMDKVCANLHRFYGNTNCYMKETTAPYMCSGLYAIRTDIWRKIVQDKSLFRDSFEEVPLNIYREQNDLDLVIMRRAFAIHGFYNTCPNHNQLEQEYYKILLKESDRYLHE